MKLADLLALKNNLRCARQTLHFGSFDFVEEILEAQQSLQGELEFSYYKLSEPEHSQNILLTSPQSQLPFAQYLEPLFQLLPNNLLMPVQKDQFLALNILLKNLLTVEALLFEYSLHETSRVDLSIFTSLEKTRQLLQILTNHSHHPLPEAIPNVYLEGVEIDVLSSPLQFLPGIFLRFTQAFSQAAHKKDFINFLAHPFCEYFSKATIEKIYRCYNQLPPKSYFHFFGKMLSRNQDACKLVIYLPKEFLFEYLHQIGWAGPLDPVKHLLARLNDLSYQIRIGIDIVQGKLGKLGLEIFPNRSNLSWKLLFSRLTDLGLCSPQKMQDLLSSEFVAWHPHFHFYFAHLNHVKISFNQEEISAKAYVFYNSSAFAQEI